MKRILLVAVLAASTGFAGSREQLMRRMGFSEAEIAADTASHQTVETSLHGTGGKSDQATVAAALREADEINKLRSSKAIRIQAEMLAQAAEGRATALAAEAHEAEEKAATARSKTREMLADSNIGPRTYSQALNGLDKFDAAAQTARQLAQEAARNAEQARASANRLAAKGIAGETKLEAERLARVTNH